MRAHSTALVALLLLGAAAPGAAQQYVVAPHAERRVFSYLGRELTIEIAAPSQGELHVARGGSGRIEVSGRVLNGFTSATLAEHAADKLRLIAVAADRVDYLVIVPEDVRVRVRLPGRYLTETARGRDGIASFAWGKSSAAAGGAGTAPAVPSTAAPPATGAAPHRLYLAEETPRVLSLPDRRGVRKVTVRYGDGDYFEVMGSRLLRLSPGSASMLEVRTSGEPIELVVRVPRHAAGFVLRVGDEVALSTERGRASAHCSPVVEQQLEGGVQWFTFTPADRRLDCGPARVKTPEKTGAREPRTVSMAADGLD